MKKQINKTILGKNIVFGGLLGLAALMAAAVVFVPEFANADSRSPSGEFRPYDSTGTSAVDEVKVTLSSSISIRVLDDTESGSIDELSIDVVPVTGGTFSKGTAIVQVGTTNPTGYYLTFSSDYKDHSDAATAALVHSVASIDDVIPTLTATDVSETDFSAANSDYADMWGYSKSWSETIEDVDYSGGSDTTYNAIPLKVAPDTLRNDVTSATNNSNTTVNFGVNVDIDKPAGAYQSTVIFTATPKA